MFFMRHGQSEFNVRINRTGRDPDMPDAPLTEMGQQQVRRAAERFEEKIDLIVASPYTRALQTASLVADVHNVPMIIDPVVGEYRLYSCDIGSPVEKLRASWPSLDFSKVGRGEWWLPFPETPKSLGERVAAFRKIWGLEEKASRLMIVSHYYFINAVTGSCPDNAEIVTA